MPPGGFGKADVCCRSLPVVCARLLRRSGRALTAKKPRATRIADKHKRAATAARHAAERGRETHCMSLGNSAQHASLSRPPGATAPSANRMARTTGIQTAAHAGARPAEPICREISAKRKNPKPPTIPVTTIVWIPPERNDRNDTVAAKRTIATHSSGRDSRSSYWIRKLLGR